MIYKDYNIQEHIVVKAIRYFVVVNEGKRERVYFAARDKRKWWLFKAEKIIGVNTNAIGIFKTRADIRKYILEQLNGGTTVSS